MDIAADWYEAREMDDGIVLITERHAAPLASCNMWLVRGRDRDVLIDTGTGASPLLPFVLGLTGREPLCILTHSHYDHIGAAHEFAERWAHPAEAEILASGGRVATLAEGWLGPHSFTALPRTGFDAATHDIRPAPATHLVDDGDEIELGDRRLNVLHLPGHSAGSIGLYEAESGILFTADVLYDGPMFFDLPGSSRADFAASLRRISELEIRRVHPGHHGSFDAARLRALTDQKLSS